MELSYNYYTKTLYLLLLNILLFNISYAQQNIVEVQNNIAEKQWLEHWKNGPQRLHWNELPLQIGDKAPDFQLLDQTGNERKLSDYWKDGPALIIFWRHNGCSCGRDRAKRLALEIEEYKKLGARVLIIAQSEPERSQIYKQQNNITVPILSDTREEAYKAYGVLEGKPSQVVYDAPDEFLEMQYQAGVDLMNSRRDTIGAVVDNPWLLTGEFVVDKSGEVKLAYRYQYCENFPDPRIHFGAIKEANKLK